MQDTKISLKNSPSESQPPWIIRTGIDSNEPTKKLHYWGALDLQEGISQTWLYWLSRLST